MIEITHLRVAYGKTIALNGIDLSIGEGVTGLFGPNGSGKSTLLRVVAGLLKPVSGRVAIEGRPAGARVEETRSRIGYAGHGSGLYSWLTVEENLLLFARLYGLSPSRVQDVTDKLGLEDRAHERVADLSAGFRRRAAVARGSRRAS